MQQRALWKKRRDLFASLWCIAWGRLSLGWRRNRRNQNQKVTEKCRHTSCKMQKSALEGGVTWHPFGPAGEMLVRDMQANRPSFCSGRQYTAVSLDGGILWLKSPLIGMTLKEPCGDLETLLRIETVFPDLGRGACFVKHPADLCCKLPVWIHVTNSWFICYGCVFKLCRGSSGLSHNIGLSGEKNLEVATRFLAFDTLSLWVFLRFFWKCLSWNACKTNIFKRTLCDLDFFLPKPFCPKKRSDNFLPQPLRKSSVFVTLTDFAKKTHFL